ncbi:MAG: amidohydrolase [Bacillota bacterium]|nr:amidohydrolase [Bacillota bacterium]
MSPSGSASRNWDLEALKGEIDRAVDRLAGPLEEVARAIHGFAETAFREERSAAFLADRLEAAGFQVTRGIAGMPTAFRADWQPAGPEARPAVALLCEYDALPGLGHACGHNLIAAAGFAAALALRQVLEPLGDRFRGRLSVFGTPAEEEGGGKIILVEQEAFRGYDAAMMFHPATQNVVGSDALACVDVRYRFHGRAAHAAAAPQQGINALDAVLLFYDAVNALRQQTSPTARLHGVITRGGDAPNVIPDLAETTWIIRERDVESLLPLLQRVHACARGAAEATGCRLELEQGRIYAERVPNSVLEELFARNASRRGVRLEEPNPHGTGSSDIGNVSRVLPALHPYLAIAPVDQPNHSRAFAQAALSRRGLETARTAAALLAATALDLLLQPELVEQAWKEFRARRA